jgi:hypothetical protein
VPRRSTSSPAATTRGREATVTDLQAFRGAQRAKFVLESLLHRPSWVRDIRVSTVDGYPVIEVTLAYATDRARMCVPSAVNSVKVYVRQPGDR